MRVRLKDTYTHNAVDSQLRDGWQSEPPHLRQKVSPPESPQEMASIAKYYLGDNRLLFDRKLQL